MAVIESVISGRLGATRASSGSWDFLVWAPNSAEVSIELCNTGAIVPMESSGGYRRTSIDAPDRGTRYFYRLSDGRKFPDPASRFQPEGVHGASEAVDIASYAWTDREWRGRPLENAVIYELHVGTYTPEGDFTALIKHLPRLADLGVTMIELMPIGQFPGKRNWGYDGVYPFAPQNSYGGPEGLQCFVNAAHSQGLAVAIDVVYNHLGPEGNYLSAFGPYFTDRYRTPWGQAINYDGPDSGEVRRFFIENALYWLEDYHFDALRLDAVHAIYDFGALHFLAELKASVATLSERLNCQLHVIAESDLNDSRLLREHRKGGYALDAQWSDDFHHAVHSLLTGEDRGYYADFGGIAPLASTLKDGWFYQGQYSSYRKRCHGNCTRGISPRKFVVCSQNHDQVGNRAAGERLSSLVGFEDLKLTAGVTLLSPFVPLLFMGEEYGEPAPFQYFTSHGDPNLVESVRRGRRKEFSQFGWQELVPDPQDEQTFSRSHLDQSLVDREPHKTLHRFYQRLIQLRTELVIGGTVPTQVRALDETALLMTYCTDSAVIAVVFNFAKYPVRLTIPELSGKWATVLYSGASSWRGPEEFDPSLSDEQRLRLSGSSFLVLSRIHAGKEEK
jgi:maltooligosyltrehalose trehalohydrolase